MVAVVFSKRYDIHCFGLERLHPFDSRKHGRAWGELRRSLGRELLRHHIPVDRAVTDQELSLVHTSAYLARLRQRDTLAAILEVPLVKKVPAWLLRWRIVQPMRWAVRGSVLAARAALREGVAVNLSGGYHHAKPDRGEGFCIFNDIALIVQQLRTEGDLSPTQRIAYVDLDAHQGNGVCYQFRHDPTVFLFDMYNAFAYPSYDVEARARLDCDLALPWGCTGQAYLQILLARLPGFLDSITRAERLGLGIYNAGTDVFAGDQLGGLELSAEDILERDRFVIDEFRRRSIPVVMLPSGGYSTESYRLIASTVRYLLTGT